MTESKAHWPGFNPTVWRLSWGVVLALMVIMWLCGYLFLRYQMTLGVAFTQTEISEDMEGMQALFEEDAGIPALVDDLGQDEVIWSPDRLHDAHGEGGLVYRVFTTSGRTLVGLEMLPEGLGWHQLSLDSEAFDRPLHVLVQILDDSHRLAVGQFEEHDAAHWQEFLVQLTIWMTLLLMVFGFINAIVVSRYLNRKMHTWLHTMKLAGEGQLNQRVPVSERTDGFDPVTEQLNDMLARFERLHHHVKNVSVGIAHDLKTPISHLSGRLQRLAQDVSDSQQVEKHIQVAEQQIENIMATFEALLRLAEIETGDRRKQFKTFDLSALISDVVDGYDPLYADEGNTLAVSIVPGILMNGDADLVAQMVSNLLENILDHAKTAANAWVRLQASQTGAVLQIGDDGPGIPEQFHNQIFDRFFQLDESRGSQGNGLGLALVKSICDLHHAEIRILPGQSGTVFDVHFEFQSKV